MSRFPELGAYADASDERVAALRSALLSWAEPEGSITVFDRACRPVEVTRDERALYGVMSRGIKRDGASITEEYDQIWFGSRIEISGCHFLEYERNAAGKWTAGKFTTMSCSEQIGNDLSQVSGDAAWYSGKPAALSLECAGKLIEKTKCPDGSVRACDRCTSFQPSPYLMSPTGYRYAPSPVVAWQTSTEACGTPCPIDPLVADVERANEALVGRVFFVMSEENAHPFLFKTKRACLAYQRIHRFKQHELEAWKSGEKRPRELPSLLADDEEPGD